jgi:hypothetical protein
MAATGGGNDNRSSVLPSQDTSGTETMPPNYSFGDELPMPDQIGVRRGGSLDDVASAVRGIAFYSDMIGFGGPSTGLTRGMPIEPYAMGVNHFIRTMTKCSNGADMWVYVNGIPKGDLMGKRVDDALRRLGMPRLRGLAPGILEDARDGLNPVPIMNAVFGTGYARCKEVTLPVGTARGSLKNVDGQVMIQPMFPGDIKTINGTPHQKRFVFDKWLTKDEWDKENQSATQCPDGSRIIDHDQNDCKKPLLKMEGFTSQMSEGLLPTALLLALAAVLWTRYKND